MQMLQMVGERLLFVKDCQLEARTRHSQLSLKVDKTLVAELNAWQPRLVEEEVLLAQSPHPSATDQAET